MEKYRRQMLKYSHIIDCGDVIRTGGDEFLVVIKNLDKVDVQAKIEEI